MANISEIFWEELIESNEFKLKIIDIGAADMKDGLQPSYQKLIDLEMAEIIGFVPNQDACNDLNKSNNKGSLYLPYFIGNGETATFYETNWAPTSSLYPPNSRLLKKFHNLNEITTLVQKHRVKTHRLDDIPEIFSADFIKMDVQGSELDVLKNGVNILNTSVIAQIEVEFVEMYKNQPLFADVDTFMRAHGFQFHCFDGGVSEQLSGRPFKPLMINNDPNQPFNQTLWADAYYVKDWMHLISLSRRQLIAYAILTYIVLGSVDLTHMILNHIDSKYKSNFAQKFLDILLQ